MSVENSYRSLVNDFVRTKRELGETETTIRRITGRDPDEVAVSGSGKYRGQSSFSPSAARASYSGRKRPAPSFPYAESEERESSYEESAEEEESDLPHKKKKKPALQSTVVAKSHKERSRKSTCEEQNANTNIKERNKRMLYSIIGTIEKFRHEEIKRQKGSMRAEIEQKVEAATEEEKLKIKREKEHLFLTRRIKQTELRCLEKKIERAESYEVFDANHRHMQNFILTKSKPPIFFLPSSHTPATKKSLEESRNHLQELVKERKEHFDADLSEIEGWYKKESLPGDKENKCPKDDGESQDIPETESESLVVEQEDTGPDDDDSNNEKNVGSLTDQDFEPIYD